MLAGGVVKANALAACVGLNNDQVTARIVVVEQVRVFAALGFGDCAVEEQRIRESSAHGLNGRVQVPHRSEEHTSELQSRENLVCRLLLEKKKKKRNKAKRDKTLSR